MGRMEKRARQVDGTFVGIVGEIENTRRKVGRPRVQKVRQLKNLELSIIVSVGGVDIGAGLFGRMEEFLRKETVSGKCSVERGGATFHLHFQAIARIQAESMIAISRVIKEYLGWDKNVPVGGVVMCRSLKNTGLHTFHGLIGYCMKDLDENHFQMVDHNLAAEDI